MAEGGFRIDTKDFKTFLRRLEKEVAEPLGQVIEHETLKVLQKAAIDVKRTTKAKAGGKFNPTSKFFKGWVRMNNKFYYVGPGGKGKKGFKYSPSMWSKLMKRLAAYRKRAETRVALSKAVFYRTAAELKLKRYGSGWDEQSELERSYKKSGGMGKAAIRGPIWSSQKVVSTTKNLRGNKPKLSFKINSTNTFNPTTQGAGKVQKAMNGRVKFFEKSVLEATVSKAKAIAHSYKGLTVKKGR